MRRIAALFAAALLAGCGVKGSESAAPKHDLTAIEVADALKSQGLPIEDVRTYTAATDPNSLLGRPGQYIGKADFVDARQTGEGTSYTIEVFDNEAAAKARRDYIEAVTKNVPFLLEYQILDGKTLVRLDKALTPDQVEQYRQVLKKVL